MYSIYTNGWTARARANVGAGRLYRSTEVWRERLGTRKYLNSEKQSGLTENWANVRTVQINRRMEREVGHQKISEQWKAIRSHRELGKLAGGRTVQINRRMEIEVGHQKISEQWKAIRSHRESNVAGLLLEVRGSTPPTRAIRPASSEPSIYIHLHGHSVMKN